MGRRNPSTILRANTPDRRTFFPFQQRTLQTATVTSTASTIETVSEMVCPQQKQISSLRCGMETKGTHLV
jgi:hypothetical protein